MAHYVAKTLHMRPNDILDNWGVPELIVAYGEYTNESTYKNYLEWKQLSVESRKGIEKPKQYNVLFYGIDKLGD